MAFGYRNEGISILGKNVMQPRGLTGLGMDTLDHSHKEVREIFEILAEATSYPLLVHCTQGKDRTGFTILLVLALLHIDEQLIQADYIMSEKELEPEREERLKEIASIGLNEEFAGCPADFIQKMFEYLHIEYGGIESYLSQHTMVDSTLQEAVKQQLAI